MNATRARERAAAASTRSGIRRQKLLFRFQRSCQRLWPRTLGRCGRVALPRYPAAETVVCCDGRRAVGGGRLFGVLPPGSSSRGGRRPSMERGRLELLVDREAVSYTDVRVSAGEADTVEQASKRPRTGKQLARFAAVRVGTTLEGDGLPREPVSLEYHELADGGEFVVVLDRQGRRLRKFSLPEMASEELKAALKVAHCKFFEAQVRQRGACRRRAAKSRSADVLRQTSRQFREIVCPGAFLCVGGDPQDWWLEFELLLGYVPQALNRFGADTSGVLDLLFSRRLPVRRAAPESPFIQRDFIDQIVKHTHRQLGSIGDLQSPAVQGLNVTLLPFQSKSVQWMLSKELATLDGRNELDPVEFLNRYVSFGYERISQSLFWNKFSNFFVDADDIDQIRANVLKNKEDGVVGAQGLLSEEMGLGKTIEILSLILLNKRQLDSQELRSFVANDGKTIYRTGASLIICPNAILQQWMDEVECHTLGNLSVFHYKGYLQVKKFFGTDNITDIVGILSKFDIIITSYNVVSMEVHYAEYNASSRPRRTISPIKYDYSSPLSLMQFYRIILDEVQMLQSDSTNAAKCTSLLHRVHTWGVSGTPIQLIRDYQTVLSYLKISPFHELPEIISTVSGNVICKREQVVSGVAFSVQELMDIFISRNLCIRHSKEDVLSQINIPKQHNYLVPLDFAPVEWDNYLDLWDQFISASGYDQNGNGTPRLSSAQLNLWLTRLRYLCCHAVFPDSGNSKAFFTNSNSNSAALQNIDDVLRLMTADAIDKLDSLYRDNYQGLIKSAQAKMELQNNPVEAIELLKSIEERILQDLRDKFDVADPLAISSAHTRDDSKTPTPADGMDRENSPKIKIRAYLDLLHQCYFFIATGYFFMGSSKLEKVDDENEKQSLIDPDSKVKAYTDVYSVEEMEDIEKNQLIEQKYYGQAEKLRVRILASRVDKVTGTIDDTRSYFDGQDKRPTSLQIIQLDDEHDYSSNMIASRCFKQLTTVINSLNDQADQFNQLLRELMDLLYKPILKEYTEETEDEKAQEYSSSIEDQDQMFGLFACLEHLLLNRDAISQSEEKEKIAKKKLKPQAGQKFSDYHRKLLAKLKLITGTPLKPIFDELKNSKVVRSLSSISKNADRQESFEDYLLQFEKECTRLFEENKKVRESLRKLNTIYNAKLEYYSHLQRISDSLVSLLQLENSTRTSLLKTIKSESLSKNLEKISTAESRVKYLNSLEKLKTSIENHQKFSCPICLGKITVGSMIKCGHFFCRKCIHDWLKFHSSCPMCKTNASLMEVYNFKFSNEEEEEEKETDESVKDSNAKHSGIVSKASTQRYDSIFKERYALFPELNEVHRMTIKESFGAKIDFVIKLILFLKLKAETENDEEPLQFVLYSQSSDFLKVIAKVLHMHEIQSLSCLANSSNVGESILKFKKHREITCLLLNVKALGAGLTLLNARHIFLLDAIINRGDELQAMGRNNRIGQTRETFVWNFMMRNSVEENIFKYKCVLESRRKSKEESQSSLDQLIQDFTRGKEREEFEMNESTGEQVSERHLWSCFFQNTQE